MTNRRAPRGQGRRLTPEQGEIIREVCVQNGYSRLDDIADALGKTEGFQDHPHHQKYRAELSRILGGTRTIPPYLAQALYQITGKNPELAFLIEPESLQSSQDPVTLQVSPGQALDQAVLTVIEALRSSNDDNQWDGLGIEERLHRILYVVSVPYDAASVFALSTGSKMICGDIQRVIERCADLPLTHGPQVFNLPLLSCLEGLERYGIALESFHQFDLSDAGRVYAVPAVMYSLAFMQETGLSLPTILRCESRYDSPEEDPFTRVDPYTLVNVLSHISQGRLRTSEVLQRCRGFAPKALTNSLRHLERQEVVVSHDPHAVFRMDDFYRHLSRRTSSKIQIPEHPEHPELAREVLDYLLSTEGPRTKKEILEGITRYNKCPDQQIHIYSILNWYDKRWVVKRESDQGCSYDLTAKGRQVMDWVNDLKAVLSDEASPSKVKIIEQSQQTLADPFRVRALLRYVLRADS